jgi:hypothetical protein
VASGAVLGGLVRMHFRLGPAIVVAAVLFAMTWVVCDQLAGLGAGTSSAAAGVLAIVAFVLTSWVTGSEQPRVRHLRTAQAEPVPPRRPPDARRHDMLAERAAPSGERGREMPETTGTIRRPTPHAQHGPAPERARTLSTHRIEFIIDDVGMRVRGKLKTVGGEFWEERLRIQWSAVRVIGFATGSNDPIVALYAWAPGAKPYHVADAQFLSHLQWTQLSELIAQATRGRLTFDAADRYNPRSIWPDW